MERRILQLLAVLSLISCGSCIRCFECKDMPTLHSCNNGIECDDGDSCYLEQFVTSSGFILYNQGCQSNTKCSNINVKRRSGDNRAVTDINTCEECCSTDYCNNAGCDQIAPPRNTRGPYCYDCDAQAGEDRCRTIRTCEIDETCAILNTTTSFAVNGEKSFRTGCIHIAQCHALLSTYHPHVTSGLSVVDDCPICCRDDFCNDNCDHNITMATIVVPVDGQWSLWTAWGTCSATCGRGEHTRTRLCNNPTPQNNGKTCTGDNLDLASCNMGTCPPIIVPAIDGQWSSWNQWSSCSVSCGDGTSSRSRSCSSPVPQNGGLPCQGNGTDVKMCVSHVHCPVDGVWGHWSRWSHCPASRCGPHSTTRTRTCHNPSGGKPCAGVATQTRDCNLPVCAASVHCPTYFHFHAHIGCVHLTANAVIYSSAEFMCKDQFNAHVLTINSNRTDVAVFNLLQQYHAEGRGIWLGMHWDTTHHTWILNNRHKLTAADYQGFATPNQPGTSNRNCVVKLSHVWVTVGCDQPHIYMCVVPPISN